MKAEYLHEHTWAYELEGWDRQRQAEYLRKLADALDQGGDLLGYVVFVKDDDEFGHCVQITPGPIEGV